MKQTRQHEEKNLLYKVTFKTNTKIPISFYTSGKVVKNVYIENANTKKPTYILVETTYPISPTEMRTFLQETKGCNVFEIYPLQNDTIICNETDDNKTQKISEIFNKRKKYDLIVETDDKEQAGGPEDSNTRLYTEIARCVDNHISDSVQKTENTINTIEYVHRENKDKRSPMMMCLALERFIIEYNTNLKPCYERNLAMIKQNIKEGVWKEMTYRETMEKLQKAAQLKEGDNTTDSKESKTKNKERRTSI